MNKWIGIIRAATRILSSDMNKYFVIEFVNATTLQFFNWVTFDHWSFDLGNLVTVCHLEF